MDEALRGIRGKGPPALLAFWLKRCLSWWTVMVAFRRTSEEEIVSSRWMGKRRLTVFWGHLNNNGKNQRIGTLYWSRRAENENYQPTESTPAQCGSLADARNKLIPRHLVACLPSLLPLQVDITSCSCRSISLLVTCLLLATTQKLMRYTQAKDSGQGLRSASGQSKVLFVQPVTNVKYLVINSI